MALDKSGISGPPLDKVGLTFGITVMLLTDENFTSLDCCAPLDLSVGVVSSHLQTYILPSGISAALLQGEVV